jgi:hypothetical protein
MDTERSKIVSASIIGASLVLSTLVASWFFYQVKSLGDTISVTGAAQRVITSDTAKWRVNVSRTAMAAETRDGSVQLKKDLDSLMAYLKKQGFETSSITIAPVMVMPNYNYNDGNRITSYNLNQEVIIESKDVQKVTKAAQDVSSLLSAGALLSTTSLEYYYSKLSDVKIEMLAEATKNAQERARRIAESADSDLGPLNSASMGVMQITAVNSVDVTDYGTYDTASLEKQVTAVVRASFRVE